MLIVVVFVVLAAFVILVPVDRHDAAVREIAIPSGSGLSRIADVLAGQGLIRSRLVFMLYVSALGEASGLKAGTYEFSRSMSMPAIVRALAAGLAKSDDREVVIPEGFNIWDIAKRLSESGLNADGGFAASSYLAEGRLFPDTYRFAKDASNAAIAAKMRANFTAKIGGRSADQITMASILEKEAKTPEDMALIAGIIIQRLARGIPLQVDATVAYGWCLKRAQADNFRRYCDVSQAPIALEIKRDSEFNTYTRTGLPPRPISNPGRNALSAAGHPVSSPYLYYLSTKDGSRIIYSQTLDEHLRNRRKYLGF